MMRTALDTFEAMDTTGAPMATQRPRFSAMSHDPHSFHWGSAAPIRHAVSWPLWLKVTIGLVTLYVVFRMYKFVRRLLTPKKEEEKKVKEIEKPARQEKPRNQYPQPVNDELWEPLDRNAFK